MSKVSVNPDIVYNKSEGAKFSADTSLRVVQCYSCGISYAIPESLYQSALTYHGDRSGGWKLCCPLGHQWWFVGETEKERLERQRDIARAESGRLAAQRDQARASARAQRAATTRVKNQRDAERRRTAAGVCPCCSRSFKQLRTHMSKMHPDYPHDAD